jgi:hypothetical protein
MSFIPDNYQQLRRYGQVFAKNEDGKYAVFFSDHQIDKDLFNDQATPWLDSMEHIFAWRHLFLFAPQIEITLCRAFVENQSEFIRDLKDSVTRNDQVIVVDVEKHIYNMAELSNGELQAASTINALAQKKA